MTSVSIIMYHYVRPLRRTLYPGIKGRDLEEFRQQINYLKRHSTILPFEHVVDALLNDEDLPPDSSVLTFDDGFSDHYRYVLPVLVDEGIKGAFYPPGRAVVERTLLDVHRTQFILERTPDPSAATSVLDDFVSSNAQVCETVHAYRRRYCQKGRWDDAETIYLKRMLQTGLPDAVRSQLTKELFETFVSTDEAAFAEDLYMTESQLRVMHRLGMHIGSHGYEHYWLTHRSEEEQSLDLLASLRFLRGLGCDTDSGWSLCYPYGDHDETTIRVATNLGCSAALTTKPRVAELRKDAALRLPRLDTNDVPLASPLSMGGT